MPKIIITADVEDAAKWEEGFRTHADLFRKQSSTALHYTITDDNQTVICIDVSDLDTFFEIFRSPATAEAMSHDGVKKATVKVYTLDKELPL